MSEKKKYSVQVETRERYDLELELTEEEVETLENFDYDSEEAKSIVFVHLSQDYISDTEIEEIIVNDNKPST